MRQRGGSGKPVPQRYLHALTAELADYGRHDSGTIGIARSARRTPRPELAGLKECSKRRHASNMRSTPAGGRRRSRQVTLRRVGHMQHLAAGDVLE